jgi:hypothetical protein
LEVPVTEDALVRVRTEEARRFGSRAYARQLLEERGHATPSGGFDRRVLRREAKVEATSPTAEASRRRLLPFELFLSSGNGSRRLFSTGPYDELRCFQRWVTTRHGVEYLSWLQPNDTGSEGFRAFGCFRLELAEELPDLRRAREFWARLRTEHAVHVLPRARVRGRRTDATGLPREGLLRIDPAMSSGVYQRDGQPDLDTPTVGTLLRSVPTPLQRITWIEEAFRKPAPVGITLHRYYMDATLRCWLVRQEGARKRICELIPSGDPAPGLWIYAARPAGDPV